MTPATRLLALTLALPLALAAPAQDAPKHYDIDAQPIQTFYLGNLSQTHDANEIATTVRNMMSPQIKLFLTSENMMTVRASPEELAQVQKILHDLDRPRNSYRLTYTLTESDAGKRIGVQRFAMTIVAGGHTTLKNGSRVPIVTGSFKHDTAASETQVTYLDIGINIDASLDEFANGARLRAKLEQSSVAPEVSGLGTQDPVVRQTVLEGTTFLTPGKPTPLGALDVVGSTRHLDVEVVMEPLRQP